MLLYFYSTLKKFIRSNEIINLKIKAVMLSSEVCFVCYVDLTSILKLIFIVDL